MPRSDQCKRLRKQCLDELRLDDLSKLSTVHRQCRLSAHIWAHCRGLGVHAVDDCFPECERKLEVFSNDGLAAVGQIPAENLLDQGGGLSPCSDPVRFIGLVGFHKGLSQCEKGGRTEADLLPA